MIIVPVHARERDRSDAIRASWARYSSSPRCLVCTQRSVKLLFVVGSEDDAGASRQEASVHNDTAVLDWAQGYYTSRAEKTLRSVMYATQHYSFRLLLKTDSDSWVFVGRLLQDLDKRGLFNRDHVYAGNFLAGKGAVANRDVKGKWYDPEYPKKTGFRQCPMHAKGAGYILSRDICEALSRQSFGTWLSTVPSEDVSMGIWLFSLTHETVQLNVEITKNCKLGVLIDHYVTPTEMAARWRDYEATGDPCVSAKK